ncbi:hypothetical protein GJ496_003699 [Pomphorhynchus laevis]|nr:hypothetical protein GJ496_003699 [Pomphorhynchus laevis]
MTPVINTKSICEGWQSQHGLWNNGFDCPSGLYCCLTKSGDRTCCQQGDPTPDSTIEHRKISLSWPSSIANTIKSPYLTIVISPTFAHTVGVIMILITFLLALLIAIMLYRYGAKLRKSRNNSRLSRTPSVHRIPQLNIYPPK